MGTTEREEGALREEDERVEGSEGRTGQQGSDEVCLGYFGFLRPLFGANILSLLAGPQGKGESGGVVCAQGHHWPRENVSYKSHKIF